MSIILCVTASIFAQKAEIFSPEGKAIKGFDPVAFFKQGKPIKGTDNLTYQWKEATWFFSTKENMDTFKANPDLYIPQYGGYCAYGTAERHKAPTETDTWTIVNNKLYFNYNKNVKTLWAKNRAELIKKADSNWEEIKDKE